MHTVPSQVNYGIAAPLLSDIASALTAAASSHTQNTRPLQRVRLHFAHCETLTPLASLLGLLRPGPQEQRGMPEVPSGRALKSAVKISPEQVRVVEATSDRALKSAVKTSAEQAGVCGFRCVWLVKRGSWVGEPRRWRLC